MKLLQCSVSMCFFLKVRHLRFEVSCCASFGVSDNMVFQRSVSTFSCQISDFSVWSFQITYDNDRML